MTNFWEEEGASMVKWTTCDSCTHLSENDSKQYTNFEICENKDHEISKTHCSTKPSNLC